MGWLVVGLLTVAAATFAGCAALRVVYPGDGRLVVVDVDPALDACPLRLDSGVVLTVGAVVRAGLHYWDAAGVRLRTPNELSIEEEHEAATVPHLRISGDPVAIAGRDWDKTGDDINIAQYRYSTGTIELLTRYWVVTQISKMQWLMLTSTLAHEFGHAIGLDHVPDKTAVMYRATLPENARDDLADADLREHARVWPATTAIGSSDGGLDGYGL